MRCRADNWASLQSCGRHPRYLAVISNDLMGHPSLKPFNLHNAFRCTTVLLNFCALFSDAAYRRQSPAPARFEHERHAPPASGALACSVRRQGICQLSFSHLTPLSGISSNFPPNLLALHARRARVRYSLS